MRDADDERLGGLTGEGAAALVDNGARNLAMCDSSGSMLNGEILSGNAGLTMIGLGSYSASKSV